METTRKPSTVAEILKEEFMVPHDLTIMDLAVALSLPANLCHAIVEKNCPITYAIAKRVGKFFGNSPEFWMNLQQNYERWEIDNNAILTVALSQIPSVETYISRKAGNNETV